MLTFLKNLFSSAPGPDYRQLVKAGAVILDVRTRGEYQGGHIKGSINMPLNEIPNSASRLDKHKPVITCCASGMRSGTAKGMLKDMGFAEVLNGGSWSSLNAKLV